MRSSDAPVADCTDFVHAWRLASCDASPRFLRATESDVTDFWS